MKKCPEKGHASRVPTSMRAGSTAAPTCGSAVARAPVGAKAAAAYVSICSTSHRDLRQSVKDERTERMANGTLDRWYVSGPLGIGTTFDEQLDAHSAATVSWSSLGSLARHS